MRLHDDMHPDDAASRLADILGMSLDIFADLFGGVWVESDGPRDYDYEADPNGSADAEMTPWHVAGDPPQLMVRVFHHGVFLARPQGDWTAVSRVSYVPTDQVFVAAEDLHPRGPEVVQRILTARRRSLRYCRYCLNPYPPEARFDQHTCYGCATRFHGVIY